MDEEPPKSSLGRWGAAFAGLGILTTLAAFGAIAFIVIVIFLLARASEGW